MRSPGDRLPCHGRCYTESLDSNPSLLPFAALRSPGWKVRTPLSRAPPCQQPVPRRRVRGACRHGFLSRVKAAPPGAWEGGLPSPSGLDRSELQAAGATRRNPNSDAPVPPRTACHTRQASPRGRGHGGQPHHALWSADNHASFPSTAGHVVDFSLCAAAFPSPALRGCWAGGRESDPDREQV